MKNTWSLQQLNFLIENYANNGSKFCVEKLNKTTKQINGKASKLGLKVNPEVLFLNKSNARKGRAQPKYVSLSQNFVSHFTKESAYVLGFLWADGFLIKTSGNIGIELQIEDFQQVEQTFFVTYPWSKFLRQRENRKPQGRFSAKNLTLYKFLFENDYQTKSISSACKILNKLPENLKHYWWRGYFDGDGCIYVNLKNQTYQVSFAGSYDQDWTFAENLLKTLNIKYTISKTIHKSNKSSKVRFTGKSNIKKFYDYIYRDMNFGLMRKFEKFMSIPNLFNSDPDHIQYSNNHIQSLIDNIL